MSEYTDHTVVADLRRQPVSFFKKGDRVKLKRVHPQFPIDSTGIVQAIDVNGVFVKMDDTDSQIYCDPFELTILPPWYVRVTENALALGTDGYLHATPPQPPKVAGVLPDDDAERKTYPLYTLIAGYFPSAIAAVAKHSFDNNEKHNPGQPLHWSRNKSSDHLEAAMRHIIEDDLVGAAWRVLAALQIKLEGQGHPVPFAAK